MTAITAESLGTKVAYVDFLGMGPGRPVGRGFGVIGKTLGHYRVVEEIGAGGMGVVYRGTDTRLGRDVALKLLPAPLARDGNRIARFEREARLLATLNHPNIAAIYGFEESDGELVIAMELVGGSSLAERLRSGPVPLEEAVPIARQIAEALAAAHEKGIIHRDLKPANVIVSPAGSVKVLDFGLAKALEDDSAVRDIASSPTISEVMSRTGIILGTAAYMSPEQARGKPLDRRTDVWSFGCVLYEMLTGKLAFFGETVSDTTARILEREPDWGALPQKTPEPIRRLLRRCLQKDPGRRLRDIGDARMEIEEALAPASAEVMPSGASAPGRERWRVKTPLTAAMAAIVLLAVATAFWAGWRRPARPAAIARLQMPTPELSLEMECTIDISRDGSRVAYVGVHDGRRQIYVRPLDSEQAKPLAGTENGWCPFFSPDGQWIAFWAEQQLKKISLSGGAAVSLYSSPVDIKSTRLKASWSTDDWVVFSALRPGGRGVVQRVSVNGGKPELLAEADVQRDEYYILQPELLPGGEALLFTVAKPSSESQGVVVQSLRTGERTTLVGGAYGARYVPSGHLLFMQAGKLMAAAFDVRQLRLTGPAIALDEEVCTFARPRSADYAFSDSGTLIYLPPLSSSPQFTLTWVDRRGLERPLSTARHSFFGPQISPDGQRLATWLGDDQQVWILDLNRQLMTRVTTQYQNFWNIWAPDNRRIVFNSVRPDSPGTSLFWQAADGTGAPERLTTTAFIQQPRSFTPDGKLLIYQEQRAETGYDILVLPVDDPGKARPLLNTRFNEYQPKLSADGRWLAYVSDESGRSEVYVRPFPAMDQKWLISDDGGMEPVWSRDGREIFYRRTNSPNLGSTLMAVAVNAAKGFSPGRPRVLFEGPYMIGPIYGTNYDVAPDGQRFAMVKLEPVKSPKEIQVVLNWFEELKTRVPNGSR